MTKAARLMGLVNLLSGRRARSIDEIAGHFQVSVRTAYRDLAELEGQHLPIIRNDYGYRMLETATIRPLNLTRDEQMALRAALHKATATSERQVHQTLISVEAKLEAAMVMIHPNK